MAAGTIVYATLPPAAVYRTAVALFCFCAAAGIVFCATTGPTFRRMGARLLFFAAGLLVGTVILVQRGQSSSFVGLPLVSIVSYEIELTDDSRRTRTGEVIHSGRLVRVYSRDGTSARAGGPILVTGGSRFFTWGDRLRAVGTPVWRADAWTARCIDGKLEPSGTAGFYFHLRNRLRSWVERRLAALRPADRALFMALFLGARDDLSGPDVYFFRRAGCIHLLALSGFHLGILSFLIVGALSPLLGRRRGVAAAAVLLAGYLFIAGPKVSLVRAVLMFGLMGGCRLAGIRARGVDLLGTVFLFSAIVWPASLQTLSFELSYLALAGIMLLSPPLDGMAASHLPKFLRAPMAASIGAQIATSPVLASRFAVLYPVGLLSSLLLTPLVTAYLWAGLALVVIPLPPTAGRLVGLLLELLHRTIVFWAELFSRSAPLRVGDGRVVLFATAIIVLGFGAVFVLRMTLAGRQKASAGSGCRRSRRQPRARQ